MIRRLVGGAAVAGIAIFGGVGAFGDDTTRNDDGEIVESGGVGAFSIQFGDCIQLPEETEIASVEGVPCSTPHDAQAFDAFEITGYSSFPGDSVVNSEAEKGCLARFEGFVGTPYEESTLYFSGLTPLAAGWAEGDHEVQCLILPETGKISFDAQDSGR